MWPAIRFVRRVRRTDPLEVDVYQVSAGPLLIEMARKDPDLRDLNPYDSSVALSRGTSHIAVQNDPTLLFEHLRSEEAHLTLTKPYNDLAGRPFNFLAGAPPPVAPLGLPPPRLEDVVSACSRSRVPGPGDLTLAQGDSKLFCYKKLSVYLPRGPAGGRTGQRELLFHLFGHPSQGPDHSADNEEEEEDDDDEPSTSAKASSSLTSHNVARCIAVQVPAAGPDSPPWIQYFMQLEGTGGTAQRYAYVLWLKRASVETYNGHEEPDGGGRPAHDLFSGRPIYRLEPPSVSVGDNVIPLSAIQRPEHFQHHCRQASETERPCGAEKGGKYYHNIHTNPYYLRSQSFSD